MKTRSLAFFDEGPIKKYRSLKTSKVILKCISLLSRIVSPFNTGYVLYLSKSPLHVLHIRSKTLTVASLIPALLSPITLIYTF